MKKILLLFTFLIISMSVEGQIYKIGKPAADFSLFDSEGNQHSLSQYRGAFVVLEWTNYECIFVQKFYRSRKMTELQETFTERGVIWLIICSSAPGREGHLDGAALKDKLIDLEGYQRAYLLDETGTVAEKYMVQYTPQAFIIDPEGKLIYAGGIDNKPTTIPLHTKLATNFIEEVLNAVLDGEESPYSETKAYGCAIKR